MAAPKTLTMAAAGTALADLPQQDRVMAEYVWVDGTGLGLRSKTRTVDTAELITDVAALPEWNFDGSSTGQAPGNDSEVILKPQAIFRDPFRPGGNNILVLCDCYQPDGRPVPSNTRHAAAEVMTRAAQHEPWFGLEQEYVMLAVGDGDRRPLGWPAGGGFPAPQGPYYCSAGADVAFGRAVVEEHYRCCLYAGVKIAGINAEVMPGQWEFQVGPCLGIAAADHLLMARYLLLRVAERHRVAITYDPKPVAGDWNGSGCHTNYSTAAMRADDGGGYAAVVAAIGKLAEKHAEHIAVYGAGNERRLTGRHETASMEKFSWGVADRGASIRVPRLTEKEGRGYFEDRRPAANADPYLVTAKIVETTLLSSSTSS